VKAKLLVMLNNKTKLIKNDNLVGLLVFVNYLTMVLIILMLVFAEELEQLYLTEKVKRHVEQDIQFVIHFYFVDYLLIFHYVLEL
jgi:hypothetical protein